MYCYRAYYGIRLPHGSNMQSSYGRKVSQSSMKVGDIIFIDHDHNGKPDHVGLYVGSGQMVHASGVKYGVICVSIKNVKDIIYVRRVR
jgi:cell wall-associated NlpC family hydrolase